MKAALFDLDGVLIDTEPRYGEFWGAIGRKYNVGIDNFQDIIKGTTLTQILSKYFPDERHQRQIVAALVEYERNMRYDIFDGVVAFLDKLKAKGVKCAIVTSSNLEKMSCLWQQHPELRQYFQAIITDEDVTHSKPDPEPYALAASKLGVEPRDCVVFEDSFNGLLSGRNAGASVVALATTNPYEALVGKADVIINNFAEYSI